MYSPGRSPDLWLNRRRPLPDAYASVVMGGRLAIHSGGSVRDSHPLPFSAPDEHPKISCARILVRGRAGVNGKHE
jgi:hypothetical protein